MHSQSRIIRLSLATTLGVVVASLCLLSLSAQPSGAAHADTPPRQAADLAPTVIYPQGFGETKPLRDLPPALQIPSTELKEIPLPHPRRDESGLQPTAPAEPDRALQPNIVSGVMPSPTANFDGIPNVDGYYPPDTNGDIGYDPSTGKKYYFQWVNVRYEAWDVTNPVSPVVVVSQTLGNALWASALPGSRCALQNDGDPIVLFDEQAHRWLISQFAIGTSGSLYHQCVAVSQSADPAGAWYVYDYQYLDGTTYLNDYPKFGVWPDPTYNAYFMSDNQFNGEFGGPLGAGVAAFERAKMLVGDPAAQLIVFNLYPVNSNFTSLLPADLDGTPPMTGTPGFFIAEDDDIYRPALGADAMRVWEMRPDWTTPASSTFGISGQPNYTLTVTTFNMPCVIAYSRSCIPQSTAVTSQKLDALGDRLMYRAAFRVVGSTQSLVVNQTVVADGADRAGIRWYELQRNSGTGSWTINQQATYAPTDGLYRWMGSLAMDKHGDMALGFSTSSTGTFPSIHYVGRLVNDTLSTLPRTEMTLTTGTGAQTGSAGRWGDYSMMGVDPQDGCTFWYTQEYLLTTGSAPWKTRIGSFRFPSCSSAAWGSITGTVTNISTTNPISGALVTALDSTGGTFDALTNAGGLYKLIGIPTGSYTLTASAFTYIPSTVTAISVSANLTTTRDFSLTPLLQADLAISKVATPDPVYASSPLTYTLRITNTGPNAASTITVVDSLPNVVTYGGVSAAGWVCGSAVQIVTCTLPNLAIGASSNIIITTTVPITAGVIQNTAVVTTNSTLDLNTSNNIATVTTTVRAVADLAISKSGPGSALPGSTVVYTLNVSSAGLIPLDLGKIRFANSNVITINDNITATPFPAVINVSGLGNVISASASILKFNHTFPRDVDVLLVSPSGQKTLLISEVGGSFDAVNLDLTLDDAASTSLPCSGVTLSSGTYKPTNCEGNDIFPAGPPVGPYSATMSVFNGTNPNGTWNLYARDDAGGDFGSIASGWELTLTTNLSSLVVTDTLPVSTTYVGASGTGWLCTQSSGIVVCTNPTFSIGSAAPIFITVTAPITAGFIVNTATVASNALDLNLANNSASVLTYIGSGTRGVTLTPSSASQSNVPGLPVTYTLRMTNTGSLPDTFALSVTGNIWNTVAPSSVGPLAAGTGANVQIVVTIATNATGGSSDVATITATSQGDNSQTASATLTTTAYYRVFLPVILR